MRPLIYSEIEVMKGAGVGDVAEELVNDAGDDEDLDEVGMIDGDPQAGENEDADAFSEDHEYVCS